MDGLAFGGLSCPSTLSLRLRPVTVLKSDTWSLVFVGGDELHAGSLECCLDLPERSN